MTREDKIAEIRSTGRTSQWPDVIEHRKWGKDHLAVLAFVLLSVVVLIVTAACSSSSSTPAQPKTGTETLNAVVTGAEAAANLNSNSNAPLSFPEGTWAGLIATTLKPFSLGGGNANQGDASWTTPAGRSTVFHKNAPGYSNNSAPPVTWAKSGADCTGHATFSKGAFQFLPGKSTGEFARLTGTGTYLVTAQFTAPLKSGKTTCTFATIGKITDSGAKIDFTATAPATLKPETATP